MEKDMGLNRISNAKITTRAVTVLYRRLYFVTRELEKPVPKLQSRLSVENRLLQENEVKDYLKCRPDQESRVITARLRAGCVCHASWYRGRIVDTSWCSTGLGPVPYFGRELVIPEGDVFIFDSYTYPRFRGFNLFMAKFAFILRTYSEQGYRRNTGVVAVENKTSMTVLKRLGCEVSGLYSSIGMGPYRAIWRRSFDTNPLPDMEIRWSYPGVHTKSADLNQPEF